VTIDVRPLDPTDRAAADELRRLAFGGPRPTGGPGPAFPQPGRNAWGLVEDGRLAAHAVDRVSTHWFGGREVPASGISAVTVASADRGRGYARTLLAALLGAARDRGAAIATLFPTAPALYRGLGWEQAGSLTWSDLPTAALAGVRPPAGTTLRAASRADSAAIRGLYTEVARAGSGYLDRTGPLFATQPVDALDGVTLALGPDGAVDGYVGWDRGAGTGSGARLTAYDVIGRTGDATVGLLATLGGWSAVTPTLRLRLPDPDPVQWLLPTSVPLATSTSPWMLRLVDVPRAVTARGWAAHLDAAVDLDIVDDVCRWNAGRHRLEVAAGTGRLISGGAGTVRIGARGLALLYAGGVTAAALRRAGLLDGGDDATDRALTALAAGPRPALLDYF